MQRKELLKNGLNEEQTEKVLSNIQAKPFLHGYFVETTETFEREFRKHRDKIEWLKKIRERLQKTPEYGKPLKGRLHGIWQIRMESFRAWYEINHAEKKVILRAMLHKDEAAENY